MPSITETMDLMKKARQGQPKGAGTRDPMATSSTASRLSTSFPTPKGISTPTGPSPPKGPPLARTRGGGEPGPMRGMGTLGLYKPPKETGSTETATPPPRGGGGSQQPPPSRDVGGIGDKGGTTQQKPPTKEPSGSTTPTTTGGSTRYTGTDQSGGTVTGENPPPATDPIPTGEEEGPTTTGENWEAVSAPESAAYQEFGARQGETNFLELKQDYIEKLKWARQNRPELAPQLEARLQNIQQNLEDQMRRHGWQGAGASTEPGALATGKPGGPSQYDAAEWNEEMPLWAGIPPGQEELYEQFGARGGQVNFMERKREYLKKFAWAQENRPDLLPQLEQRLQNIEDNIRRQMEQNGWKPGGGDDGGGGGGNKTTGGGGGGTGGGNREPAGGKGGPGLTQEVLQKMVDGLYDFQNNETPNLVTEEMSSAYKEALQNLAQTYGFNPTKGRV